MAAGSSKRVDEIAILLFLVGIPESTQKGSKRVKKGTTIHCDPFRTPKSHPVLTSSKLAEKKRFPVENALSFEVEKGQPFFIQKFS